MPKQKLPKDHCAERAKVCKTGMQTFSQTRNENQRMISNQSQCQTHIPHQGVASTSAIKDPSAGNEFDSFIGIRTSSSQNQNLLPVDQVQSTEIVKQRIAEADLKIKKLRKTLHQAKEKNKILCKYHDGKVKTQNEIVDKQTESWRFMSSIQDQTNELADTLKRYQECHEDLTKLHENLNFNQAKIKDLAKRFKDQIHDNRELKATLISKANQLSVLKNNHQQLENELMEKNQLLYTVNKKREDMEKSFLEKREKHLKDVSELSRSIKESEENLKTERERKNKLIAESSESSKRMEELSSKLQVLQLKSVEYKKQEEVLKSSTQMLKGKVTSLDNERNNLESEHLGIISKKNSELSLLEKEIQDLKLMHTELAAKLKEIISENEKLLKTTVKPIEDIEQLENNLKNKDNELMKINSELTNTLAKNEELSVNTLTLKGELIVKEEKICQLRANYMSREDTVKKQIREEAEIKEELTMIEEKIETISADISDLLATASDEKEKMTEQIKDLGNNVVMKNKQIIDLKELLATLERELKDDESRYSSEIQQKTDLAEQCTSLGHEEKMKEQNKKIDLLNRELSALKRVNKKAAIDRQKKKIETELYELKSNFNELSEKFSALGSENEALEKKLKDAKTLIDEEFTQGVEVLGKPNSSTSITNRENELSQSMPAISPLKPILKSYLKDSPRKVQKVRFDSLSSLDIDNIDGLEMMKEAEQRFIDSTVSNRPDWANLDVLTFTEESEESPFVTTSQPTQSRKFFKRTIPEKKNTDPFDEDSNDPYAFK